MYIVKADSDWVEYCGPVEAALAIICGHFEFYRPVMMHALLATHKA